MTIVCIKITVIINIIIRNINFIITIAWLFGVRLWPFSDRDKFSSKPSTLVIWKSKTSFMSVLKI